MVNSRKIKIYRQRFEEVKKIKKKTMLEICDEAQVKYETVRYCLRNGSMMPDILDRLAKTIGCDVGYLTGEHSFIYYPAIHENHTFEEDGIFGVDSSGIEILVYESGREEIAFDSASDAFEKMMSYLRDALSINVISADGQKRKYTFDDYLRDRAEVDFYNSYDWEKKPVPDWSKIDTSEVDFSEEFDIVVDALSNQMKDLHDNKDKKIQHLKEMTKPTNM